MATRAPTKAPRAAEAPMAEAPALVVVVAEFFFFEREKEK
jgi:hypothetical protein